MREAFARDLADPERPLFIARLTGEVVGYGRTALFEPPPDAPADVAPAGYYLAGLLVDARHRRRRLGRALTQARMTWVFERTDEVFYFTAASNRASIALHTQLGFVALTRSFTFPGVSFDGEQGYLARATRP